VWGKDVTRGTAGGRRVCFANRYCYPDKSATSQLLTDLAGELSAGGWHVTLVGSRQRYDDPDALLPSHGRWRGVDIRRVPGTRFGRGSRIGCAVDYFSFCAGLLPTLWRSLRRGDVIVVATAPPLLGVLVTPMARLCGARSVNWLHDLFPEIAITLGEARMPGFVSASLRWLRNWSLRHAAANVVVGKKMRSYLEDQGVPATRLALIPDWPQEDAIRPLPARESRLRQRLDLQHRFVVGYSGNLGPAHEWKPLFDAARLLVAEERVVFLMGGGGRGLEALRATVAESGLGNVLFQPYHPLETLSDSMAAADVHLVSLQPELDGLVLPGKFYDIAAAARPIGFIGDESGELARLIRSSDCGFTVAAGRGDLLAEAIAALSRSEDAALVQGARARALLEDRFSRSSAHGQWHDLLAGVADGRRPDHAQGNGSAPG
jgi:glycosyltransferase involved in cell wall biosynthesis